MLITSTVNILAELVALPTSVYVVSDSYDLSNHIVDLLREIGCEFKLDPEVTIIINCDPQYVKGSCLYIGDQVPNVDDFIQIMSPKQVIPELNVWFRD